MHDADDLLAVQTAVLGRDRPDDNRRRGRVVLGDVRAMLCHTVLLLFDLLSLVRHRNDRPPHFVGRVAGLLQVQLRAPLGDMLSGRAGALANRWAPVREALSALAAAVERVPLPTSELESLRRARASWLAFAAGKFLLVDGAFPDTQSALELLDPFGGSATLSSPLSPSVGEDAAAAPDSPGDVQKGAVDTVGSWYKQEPPEKEALWTSRLATAEHPSLWTLRMTTLTGASARATRSGMATKPRGSSRTPLCYLTLPAINAASVYKASTAEYISIS